jgi:hypothetical protein
MGKYKDILDSAETFEEHFMKPVGTKSTGIPKNTPKVKVANDKFTSGQIEKLVRDQCNTFLKNNGWVVKTIYTGGIPVMGRLVPNPCKGIPDTICFNIVTKRRIWIEYKRNEGGKLDIEQIKFHELLTMVGDEVFVVTSLKTLQEMLNGKK